MGSRGSPLAIDYDDVVDNDGDEGAEAMAKTMELRNVQSPIGLRIEMIRNRRNRVEREDR